MKIKTTLKEYIRVCGENEISYIPTVSNDSLTMNHEFVWERRGNLSERKLKTIYLFCNARARS